MNNNYYINNTYHIFQGQPQPQPQPQDAHPVQQQPQYINPVMLHQFPIANGDGAHPLAWQPLTPAQQQIRRYQVEILQLRQQLQKMTRENAGVRDVNRKVVEVYRLAVGYYNKLRERLAAAERAVQAGGIHVQLPDPRPKVAPVVITVDDSDDEADVQVLAQATAPTTLKRPAPLETPAESSSVSASAPAVKRPRREYAWLERTNTSVPYWALNQATGRVDKKVEDERRQSAIARCAEEKERLDRKAAENPAQAAEEAARKAATKERRKAAARARKSGAPAPAPSPAPAAALSRERSPAYVAPKASTLVVTLEKEASPAPSSAPELATSSVAVPEGPASNEDDWSAGEEEPVTYGELVIVDHNEGDTTAPLPKGNAASTPAESSKEDSAEDSDGEMDSEYELLFGLSDEEVKKAAAAEKAMAKSVAAKTKGRRAPAKKASKSPAPKKAAKTPAAAPKHKGAGIRKSQPKRRAPAKKAPVEVQVAEKDDEAVAPAPEKEADGLEDLFEDREDVVEAPALDNQAGAYAAPESQWANSYGYVWRAESDGEISEEE
ncbi:hypothetical protein H2200_007599 [Cladophialophora chaetospira]|uniref:Uncharacterized protein n=1 Tax=Cladophialophora chaetospira TaxID=386627 RepID=A0AA38X660_9EURO|nr:hypothetical protein H2200_007599 [Cladophialophora chaetospira]